MRSNSIYNCIRNTRQFIGLLLVTCFFTMGALAQTIPLPEHPRPDFERANWINLNGQWDFEFDSLNKGVVNQWHKGATKFSKKISSILTTFSGVILTMLETMSPRWLLRVLYSSIAN